MPDYPDVTVIIAAYNSMPYIETTLQSLVDQSLGLDRIQVIAVDDGSTDDTGQVLDAYASANDAFTIIHQENSGGPAGPRNRALDLVESRYLFFLDADDYLAPDALERMVEVADENGTDVVLARIKGMGGRSAPASMFRSEQPSTSVLDSNVYWTLNPMKMFRTRLVQDLNLRFPLDFPWGEDQPFVAAAYFNARGISVLADKDYIFWTYREDGANITTTAVSLRDRMPVLDHMFDFVAAHVDEGPSRDRLLRRHFQVELLGSVLLGFLDEEDKAYQRRCFDRLREITSSYYTAGIESKLPPRERVLMYLIGSDRYDEFLVYLESSPSPDTVRLAAEDGLAYLRLPWFRDSDHELPDALFDVTDLLKPECSVGRLEFLEDGLHLEAACTVGPFTEMVSAVELVLVERTTKRAAPVGLRHSFRGDGATREAVVDEIVPVDVLLGDSVPAGILDLYVRLHLDEYRSDLRLTSRRLRSGEVAVAPLQHRGGDGALRSAEPYLTRRGSVSVRLADGLLAGVTFHNPDEEQSDYLMVTLPVPALRTPVRGITLTPERDGKELRLPVKCEHGGALSLELGGIAPGRYRMSLATGAVEVPLVASRKSRERIRRGNKSLDFKVVGATLSVTPVAGKGAGSSIRIALRLARHLIKPLADYARNPQSRVRAAYTRYLQHVVVADRTVVFETTIDDAIRCNPGALFLAMLGTDEFRDYRLVWAIGDSKRRSRYRRMYRNNANVTFVPRGSKRHARLLAEAKYVITNGSLPAFFQRRPEQLILNTWHGVPLKAMGFDIPGRRADARNVLRVLMQCDFLVSGSEYETKALFTGSHKLENIYEGRILEVGHPRVDRLISADSAEVRSRLRRCGVAVPDEATVVLYAPTWRGASHFDPRDTTDTITSIARELRERLGGNTVLLLKLHPLTAVHLKHERSLEGMIVPTDFDASELLSATDILVTDYSSMFVDFLVTDRPVFFLIDDVEEYSADRGLYVSVDRLPGPIARTPAELADLISQGDRAVDSFRPRYKEMRQELCSLEDGAATERVLDAVFRGNESYADVVAVGERKRVLLGVGGFGATRLSRSILALLKRIDPALYDASVFTTYSEDPGKLTNVERMPAWIRPLLRGRANTTLPESLLLYALDELGPRHVKRWMSRLEPMFRREWVRSFGSSHFDVVIDLAGTSFMNAGVMSAGAGDTRLALLRGLKPSARRVQSRVLELSPRFSSTVAARELPFLRMIDAEVVRTEAESYHVERVNGERLLMSDCCRTAQKGIRLPSSPQSATFVAVKANEAARKLILAGFSEVADGNSETRLCFVVDARELKRVQEVVDGHMHSERISVESVANPLAYVWHGGCLVAAGVGASPPILVLECAAAGAPTIIGSTTGSISRLDGTGRLFPNTTMGIADGMRSYLDGRLLQKPADLEQSNQQALVSFYEFIEGRCADSA